MPGLDVTSLDLTAAALCLDHGEFLGKLTTQLSGAWGFRPCFKGTSTLLLQSQLTPIQSSPRLNIFCGGAFVRIRWWSSQFNSSMWIACESVLKVNGQGFHYMDNQYHYLGKRVNNNILVQTWLKWTNRELYKLESGVSAMHILNVVQVRKCLMSVARQSYVNSEDENTLFASRVASLFLDCLPYFARLHFCLASMIHSRFILGMLQVCCCFFLWFSWCFLVVYYKFATWEKMW